MTQQCYSSVTVVVLVSRVCCGWLLQDPCTWRIVLKNTVDLEPQEVQAAAKEKLDALVLSYQHLDSLIDMAREGNAGGCSSSSSRGGAQALVDNHHKWRRWVAGTARA